MSAYDTVENATCLTVSYLVSVAESGLSLRGWALLADPSILGDGLDLAAVSALHTTDDGAGDTTAQVLSYTPSDAKPVLALSDGVSPGTSVLYTLTLPKAAPPTPSHRRQYAHRSSSRRRLADVSIPKGAGTSVIAWSEAAVAATILPSDLTGPGSIALASGAKLCTGGSGAAARTVSSLQLFGAEGCLRASVRQLYTQASNRTTVTVQVYGNSDAASGVGDCEAWLASLPQPVFVRMLLADTALGQLQDVAASSSSRRNPALSPYGVFVSDGAVTLPRGSIHTGSGGAVQLAFTLRLSGTLSVGDICAQGALTDQMPDTCVLQLVYVDGCEEGVADGYAVGVAPVGSAPEVLPGVSARPPPGSTLLREEVGTAPGVAQSGSGLSSGEVAIIACFVVGFGIVALVSASMVVYRARRKWRTARDEINSNNSGSQRQSREQSVGQFDRHINLEVGTMLSPPPRQAGGLLAVYGSRSRGKSRSVSGAPTVPIPTVAAIFRRGGSGAGASIHTGVVALEFGADVGADASRGSASDMPNNPLFEATPSKRGSDGGVPDPGAGDSDGREAVAAERRDGDA